MAASTTGENLLMTFLFTTTALSGGLARPTTWYVGLHTGAPGANGTTNEISGLGYARQAETFTVTGNVATGVSALTYGPDTTTDWGSVSGFSVWDSLTGGRCFWVGTLTGVSYAVGDSATVAGAAITFTLT